MAIDMLAPLRGSLVNYYDKGTVNVSSDTRAVGSSSARRILLPEAPFSGSIVHDSYKASSLVALSIDTVHKVLSVVEGLRDHLQSAIDGGTTLTRSTDAPEYYLWQNEEVTGVGSTESPTIYDSGDRSGSIDVTTSYGLLSSGIASNTVDGQFDIDIADSWTTNAVEVYDHWYKFDFGEGASKIIDEVTWQGIDLEFHGTWQWQGSNDDDVYFHLGDTFTLGGEAAQVQDLGGNTDGYRYYRLIGISGTAETGTHQEVFFKVIDATPPPATVDENKIAESLNTIADELQRGLASIDNLVRAAETFDTNILSSNAREVTLKASRFGGALHVTPQPVDTAGLGIQGLKALSADEATDALDKITAAYSTAQAALSYLQELQNGLFTTNRFNDGNLAGGQSTILPGGSLVDLIA